MPVESRTFRRVARDAVAKLLVCSGTLARQRRRRIAEQKVCVLGLHRVLKDQDRGSVASGDAMIMGEEPFAAMLEYLAGEYEFLTLADFLARREPGSRRPAVLLTFDDGWADNYATAFPVLRRMRIPATIFLATDFVGSEKTFWIEQLLHLCKDPAKREQVMAAARAARLEAASPEELIERLKRMPTGRRDEVLSRLGCDTSLRAAGDAMLSWEAVREMAAAGITFASHTASHPLLTFEEDGRVRDELMRSREVLERVLGQKIQALAYPNGDYDSRICEHARDAGYECAFTTERRWCGRDDDRWALPRFLIHDGSVVDAGGRFSRDEFEFTLTGWR